MKKKVRRQKVNIIFPSTPGSPQAASFPQVSQPKPSIHLCCPPYVLVSHTIGRDDVNPSPAPHFKTFKIFCSVLESVPSFSIVRSCAVSLEFHYLLPYVLKSSLLVKRASLLLNTVFAMAVLDFILRSASYSPVILRFIIGEEVYELQECYSDCGVGVGGCNCSQHRRRD